MSEITRLLLMWKRGNGEERRVSLLLLSREGGIGQKIASWEGILLVTGWNGSGV